MAYDPILNFSSAVHQYVADQYGAATPDDLSPENQTKHLVERVKPAAPYIAKWEHAFAQPTTPQLEAAWATVELRLQREPNAIAGMQSIQNAVKQINSPATAASYLTANYDLTGVPAGAQQALRDIYYAYSMLVRRMYPNESDWFNTGE